MTASTLIGHESLSPESVLVLPPDLLATARLGPPSWPTLRPYAPEPVAEHVLAYVVEDIPECAAVEGTGLSDEPFRRVLGEVLANRVIQPGLIFLAVTLVILVLSVVAHAVR